MRFRIEHKMILGYLPIILIILVIAFFSYRSLNELSAISRSIIQEDAFLIQAVDQMEESILAQESYGRRYLILDNRQMLDLFWRRDQEFSELVERVRTLPRCDEIFIEKLVSLHDDFTLLFTNDADLAEKQAQLKTGEFDKLVSRKFDQMITILQQMKLFGKQNQYVKMEKANTIGIRSFRFTVLLSGLAIIFGFGSVSIITRSISRSISELKYATEVISEGKYDYRLNIHTRDEMSDLAASLRLMAMRLSRLEKKSLDSSPLTRMPGGLAIETVLTDRLEKDGNVAFCMLDLDNFKSYNDRYGYAKGNEVIRSTAAIIQSAVAEHGTEEDFIGHIGGDDFAIITDTARYDAICKTIIKQFDESIVDFYNSADRERGYIVAKNRQGHQMTFPLMTISIAVVTNDRGKKVNQIEIGEIASELKAYAKSTPGSTLVTDRRGHAPKFKADHAAATKT